MKRSLSVILIAVMLFSVCACSKSQPQTKADNSVAPTTEKYQAISEIDHCVVEPDDKLHMSDEDEAYYRLLMDAMLDRKDSIALSDNKEKNEYYIDLLRQSPYYFFAERCEVVGNKVEFEYAYTEPEQSKMLEFLDKKFLDIANHDIGPDDNTLDIILKVHSAVARQMNYDHSRTDNKQLGSPLFNYPSDEIYKALYKGESLCYGFAYTFRFALLQHGIDCFCVYGPCANRNEAHMWNIFKYDGKFYTCDTAWDRSEEEYPQLFNFGKTDAERFSDGLETREYSSKFFGEYGEVKCTSETFKIFRGIDRYAFTNNHTYYMVDFDGKEMLFDTRTLVLK